MGNVTEIKPTIDPMQRYVRVTARNERGYVEFQFSIGDPSLYLEMTLPEPAFAAFCREQAAKVLSDDEGRKVDLKERRWRYGDEGEN